MLNVWRWIPHRHNRRPLFSGGDKGADRCLRCGKIFFWIIDTNIGITFSFEGWGKAIKEKNNFWKDRNDGYQYDGNGNLMCCMQCGDVDHLTSDCTFGAPA